MKILYSREMYRNQKTSGQCRQVSERVELCQTNLQMAFPTFHKHACYWSPENVNWNSRKPNRRYHFLMELGKELTKPNIMLKACNPIGFKLHVRRAIESMGFCVTSNSECSSSRHPQRKGPMRNAKEEDVFDALEKMMEKFLF